MTAAIRIWVGTEDGLHEFDTAGGSGATHHAGRAVTALGAEYPDLWAILDGTEVWKTSSADGFQSRTRPSASMITTASRAALKTPPCGKP